MLRRSVGAFVVGASGAALLVSAPGPGPAEGAAPARSANWLSWGRTLDQNRYSPLTQINRRNIGNLGRVFSVDFRQIDPTILRGQQSFPLVVNGRIYVTTADNNVFALNATTGKVVWRYKPSNTALFANFGIRTLPSRAAWIRSTRASP